MNHALIGEIAGVMALVQTVPYVVDIFRGHTKPERMTYLIWLIVDTVTITSYIAAGAKTGIWVGLAYMLTGLSVFVLSFKYGIGGFSKFDVVCLILALSGVLIWATSRDALVALYFSVIVAKIGYLPTIKKPISNPKQRIHFLGQ